MKKREIVLIDREFTYCKMFELLRLEHKTGNIHLMKFIAKKVTVKRRKLEFRTVGNRGAWQGPITTLTRGIKYGHGCF